MKKINRRMIRKLIQETLDMQGNPVGGGNMSFLSGIYYEVVNSAAGGAMGRPRLPDEDDVLGAFDEIEFNPRFRTEMFQNMSQLGIRISTDQVSNFINAMIVELERGSGRLGSLLIAAENRDLGHWSQECKELMLLASMSVKLRP